MIVKHYALFKSEPQALKSAKAWNDLRTDPSEPSFFIPDSKKEYTELFENNQKDSLSTYIEQLARQKNCNHIFSVGSGIAALEHGLKRHTDLKVTVSDYNDSVFRLAKFDIFDNVLQFDALKDAYPIDKKTIVLFNRIDTEFDDTMWQKLFTHLSAQDVVFAICIPTQFLTLKAILVEAKIWLTSILTTRKRTDCGYIRSKQYFVKGFEKFFHHQLVSVSNRQIFILHKK